jgi:AcrR family transcriptional regulator
MREPKQERSAATREKLLEAAIATLAKRGYADTTTSTIAEEAGVTRGAIQHHFASREQLLDCALDYLNEKRCEQVHEMLAGDRDSLSTADVLDIIREQAFGDFFKATLVFFMGIHNHPDYREIIRRYDKKVADKLGEVIEWYFGTALLKDPEGRELIRGTLAMIRGVQLMHYLMPGSKRMKTTIMGPDSSGAMWEFWRHRIAGDIDRCIERLRREGAG